MSTAKAYWFNTTLRCHARDTAFSICVPSLHRLQSRFDSKLWLGRATDGDKAKPFCLLIRTSAGKRMCSLTLPVSRTARELNSKEKAPTQACWGLRSKSLGTKGTAVQSERSPRTVNVLRRLPLAALPFARCINKKILEDAGNHSPWRI